MSTVPSHIQIPYSIPSLPTLLSLAAYLYLLSTTASLSNSVFNAPLLGPIIIGILLGPNLAGLLITSHQQTLIDLGYIGLLLIVFEAGLATHIPTLFRNATLSFAAAITGIVLPITVSIGLLKAGWHYSGMQAFAAGASLCSTSLGTTLSLLDPQLRRTRVGSVLMCAALLDDIVGLAIAGIISGLAKAKSAIDWKTIVRPLLASLAFGLFTPLFAYTLRRIFLGLGLLKHFVHNNRFLLFVIVVTLSGFVTGSIYAGTSELFGAYLAGSFLAYILRGSNGIDQPRISVESNDDISHPLNPPLLAFSEYILPILTPLLAPIFFSSIGAAIPVRTLFTTHSGVVGSSPSHRVVWRGIVYAVLMILAKLAVGLWMLVWPEGNGVRKIFTLKMFNGARNKADHNAQVQPFLSQHKCEPSPRRAACLLGLAMVARGEIALIVAQIARPLLLADNDEEPFAIVTWAVLLSTIAGALAVGALLGFWKRRDFKSENDEVDKMEMDNRNQFEEREIQEAENVQDLED